MQFGYIGKRNLFFNQTSEARQGEEILIIDIVGMGFADLAPASDTMMAVNAKRVYALVLHTPKFVTSPLQKYYRELFEQLLLANSAVIEVVAPPLLEELHPYRGIKGPVYGAYQDRKIGWSRVSELVENLISDVRGGGSRRIDIIPSIRLGVHEALMCLEGKAGNKGGSKYISLNPVVFQEYLRTSRYGDRDKELVNQLPYYQYYSSFC